MAGLTFASVFMSLATALIVYGVYKLFKVIYWELTLPSRDLPGPKIPSLIWGHVKEVEQNDSLFHEVWPQKYGNVFQLKGFLNMSLLIMGDAKALNHILMNNNYDYQKATILRYSLSRMVGPGVLVVEGDEHKRQRKIMNPAFSPANIRQHTKSFVEKAIQLRDIWAAESVKEGGIGRVDALSWLSKLTLDVIGLAGFNYAFDSLNNQRSELSEAFDVIFKPETQLSTLTRMTSIFPILRFIPSEHESHLRQAQDTMARIGNQLLSESKSYATGTGDKRSGRDLLSLLVRANMEPNLSKSQRLSDKDVLAQVPTFIVAGHETTSNGMTWGLFELTRHLRVQTKLREELFTIDTDSPTMDQLNALPYLDMVVRESLRVHPPVATTSRVSMKDDILPLKEPVTDRNGKEHLTVRVKKGQMIVIPILAVNKNKSIWGEDADEFRPERWEAIPEASDAVPGVWGNMLTFLGGNRACIGYRFSLIEMKVVLFTLIRAFELELAVPSEDIWRRSTGIVYKPVLATDPEGPCQMPLLIKPYNRA